MGRKRRTRKGKRLVSDVFINHASQHPLAWVVTAPEGYVPPEGWEVGAFVKKEDGTKSSSEGSIDTAAVPAVDRHPRRRPRASRSKHR